MEIIGLICVGLGVTFYKFIGKGEKGMGVLFGYLLLLLAVAVFGIVSVVYFMADILL